MDPSPTGAGDLDNLDEAPFLLLHWLGHRYSMTTESDRLDKIVLGLWPIAGVTTIGVTPAEADATMATAIDAGITRFDTAYSYGFDGESDRLLGKHVRKSRDRFYVMGKVGQRWDADRKRVVDGSEKQLRLDAEASLDRMALDHIDLLFLHQPDPKVPLDQSARAMQSFLDRGLCRQVGICNATPEQIEQFATMVPTSAIQCPLNMLQRDSLSTHVAPSEQSGRDVFVFWTLMKGLLAGKITRHHVFPPGDSRPGYAIFQGEFRQRVHDAMIPLADLASSLGMTIAQLSVSWTLSQAGVSGALVGARRPEQIRETVDSRCLSAESLSRIEQILTRHNLP